MARVHFWNFMQDSIGASVEGADVSIYLAGTTIPANLFTSEIGGSPISEAPQLKTNALGYFEFWISDGADAQFGYSNDQKFKIVATRVGIADIMIDYVDVLSAIQPVDPESDDETRNKAISNKMAKQWNSLLNFTGHEVFGIREINLNVTSSERNKLISNDLGILWQNHRKFNFNTNIPSSYSADEDLMPWENMEYYPALYGAHGIQVIQLDGTDRSDTVKNKLISNANGNKWEEHTNYSFKDHDISAPDFNEPTPHGLYRANFAIPPFDLEDPNAPFELVKEYNDYNKLVSNRLIREMMYDSEIKMSETVRFVKSEEWKPSMHEKDIYVYTLAHNLNTKFIGVSISRKVERINPNTGAIDILDNIFSPEDIFILSENTIEIHSSRYDDSYITVWGRKDLLKAMNEESSTGGGTGEIDKFRVIMRSSVSGAKVKFSGDNQKWWDFTEEIYMPPAEYVLTFSDVEGYITPDPIVLDLRYNRLLEIEYEKIEYSVRFDVNLPNQKVTVVYVDEEGIYKQFSMDDEIKLVNGQYVLEFSKADGYLVPSPQNLIVDNKVEIVKVEYKLDVPHYTITFESNVNNATVQVYDTIENSNFIIVIYNGMELKLPTSTYKFVFGDVEGMTSPSEQIIDLTEDTIINVKWEII